MTEVRTRRSRASLRPVTGREQILAAARSIGVRHDWKAVTIRAVAQKTRLHLLCYARTPSSGFQPNASLLHPDPRVRAAQLYILNGADFKGVPAG